MTSSLKTSLYHALKHPLLYISIRIRKARFFQNKALSILRILPKLFKTVDKKISSFSKKARRKAIFKKSTSLAMPLEWLWKKKESVDSGTAFGGFLTNLSMWCDYLDYVFLQTFFKKKKESIGRWCGQMLFSCKHQPKRQLESKSNSRN